MILTDKQCLATFLLFSLTTASYGYDQPRVRAFDKAMPIETTCLTGPYVTPPSASVTFTHGSVINQEGKSLEPGMVLSVEDVVHLGKNGFLSITAEDGRTVNIQPGSSISLACALTSKPINADITQPYTLGGIRG